MHSRTATLLIACLCALARPATAETLMVNAGGDLQAAINAAQPGDTILLQAGATFTGGYTLPPKSGSAYITIRSSAPDSSLPPPGARMTPAYASLLPKLRASNLGPAIRTLPGARYWRLQFLEFLPASSTASVNLVELGSSTQDTVASVPSMLEIDRCYLHGDPSYGHRRGLALNSGDTRVLNSYFADFKMANHETQAIAGWTGPGPYVIENNYIEASGENILFGGGDPRIVGLVPSHITIRRNHISRPLAWRQENWPVKNLIELKNAHHVLIEGNVIEHNWTSAQTGYAILFTPRNQDGTAPWSSVKHVRVQNNIIRRVAAVFNISGYDNVNRSAQTENIVVRNNLVHDVSTVYGVSGNPAPARLALIHNGPRDITFEHNTVDNDGSSIILFDGAMSGVDHRVYGFALTNNLLRDNAYGVFGSGVGEGSPAFAHYTPNATVLRNAFAGASPQQYPTGNDFPAISQWLADFVAVQNRDYRLVSWSPSIRSGTDGKDLGVDFAELNAALSGTTAPSSPAAASTPFGGSPAAVPGTIQAENFDNGGANVAYRDNSSGNAGGAYRATDVDLEATSDSGGGYNVGWTAAGEWLNYTVNVAAAGSYTIEMRVASSGTGGTFHIEANGTNVTGPMSIPNTGGWQAWTTLARTGVTLAAGVQALRLVADANGPNGSVGNVNWIRIVAGSSSSGGSTPFTGSPSAVPGTIQMENFDNGGANVAYRDNSPGNAGSAYRATDVDIEATGDAGGGHNVGWAGAGEWLNYTVQVASAGAYTLDVRVAANGTGGTFHVEANGTNVTGPISIPNTGGWQAWTTVSRPGIVLAAGTQILRVVLDTAGPGGVFGNFNWMRLTHASTPYSGSPVALPGTIQAENFDHGGAGVAYHDLSSGNSGGAYRTGVDVDIEATSDAGGGHNVGWVSAGEWLVYTVDVAVAGTYTLDVRVASPGAGGVFHVEVNGVDRTGALTVPSTGGWQAWTTVTRTGIALTAGRQVLRLVMDSPGAGGALGNFNWLRVR